MSNKLMRWKKFPRHLWNSYGIVHTVIIEEENNKYCDARMSMFS